MWVTSLGLAGEAGIFTSLPFYPMFSGVPNGLLRLSPPQVHAAVHNSGDMNRNHFQLAMLAYNRNCWLLLFNREAQASVETLRHTTLRRRGCVFCSWRPRSGGTPAERVSATAIIIRKRACLNG